MTHLDLTDCIQATPARTLVALSRELSIRARRSLGRHAGRRRAAPGSEGAFAAGGPARMHAEKGAVATNAELNPS